MKLQPLNSVSPLSRFSAHDTPAIKNASIVKSLMGVQVTRWVASFLAILVLGMFTVGPANAARKTYTCSEKLKSKLLCPRGGGACTIIEQNNFKAKFVFEISEAELAALGSGTEIDVLFGAMRMTHTIGDDPKYKPGRRSVKIAEIVTNDVGKVIGKRYIRLNLNIKKRLVTCSVYGNTKDLGATGWDSPAAGGLTSFREGIIQYPLATTVRLGNTSYKFDSTTAGKIRQKEKRGRDRNYYTMPSVQLKGFSVEPPTPINQGNSAVIVTEGSDAPAGNTTAGVTGSTLHVTSGPLAGTTITVPVGAVGSETQFFAAHNDAKLTPKSGTYKGDSLSIHTDGQTTFKEPLTITVPFTSTDGKFPVPYYVYEGRLRAAQIKGVDRSSGKMSFETYHASLYTWIMTELTNDGGHTTFSPATDGFQIVNRRSIYNPAGECFGMAAFAQWHFANKGGGLYPKYMQDIPTSHGLTVKGQDVIATRAHTSVSQLWNQYVPGLSPISGSDSYVATANVLANTANPAIIYLSNNSTHGGAHAVLAYDHVGANELLIYDPNYPGTQRSANLSLLGNLTYDNYRTVQLIGNGSFMTEPYEDIFKDAEVGFDGSGQAQVSVTSHTDGEIVTGRTITVTGKVESGEVLVKELTVILNGTTEFPANIDSEGNYSVAVSLSGGKNELTFRARGRDLNGNAINAPNDQKAPFIIDLDSGLSNVLVTLTWDTNYTDLDLYTIDPTGDYSSYFHETTADGGELDYDDTDGYGPEHWTLAENDTVRWGQAYSVRAHYYSGSVPTRWNASVVLYEGTPRSETYNFSGVLTTSDSGNDQPGDTGADWADVCTITPVAPGTLAAPQLKVDANGKKRILVPVPDLNKRLQIKAQNAANQ